MTAMNNPFLVGEKVYLRPVEKSDAPLVQRWHNDPDIRKSARLGELPVTYTKEEADIDLARDSEDEIYLLIVKKKGDRPIGFIRLHIIDRTSHNMWLRMIIGDKNARGADLANDALLHVVEWLFSEQNVHRITLETYETNERALRFFKKIGFKQEGVLREAVYKDGKYYNIISLGLLKKEFKK
jgi:RimJ/RimL family protein N-acetyltransferase